MNSLDASLLTEILRSTPDGIAVIDGTGGGARVLYANATLAALLRRAEEWPAGRLLEEIEIELPRDPETTVTGGALRVRLRRGDGTGVECERWVVPLSDGRMALHYRVLPIVVHGASAVPADRSGGLSTPEHLLEVLRRDWSIAQRDQRRLTLMRFDLDGCRDYLEVFGRGATDNVLRQAGRTIASAMRRSSDVVARFADDEFAVLGVAMDPDLAREHAEQILGRVRALAIHHPRSRTGRYLTLSCGVVTAIPPRDRGCEILLEATQRALAEAKQAGGGRAVVGSLPGDPGNRDG